MERGRTMMLLLMALFPYARIKHIEDARGFARASGDFRSFSTGRARAWQGARPASADPGFRAGLERRLNRTTSAPAVIPSAMTLRRREEFPLRDQVGPSLPASGKSRTGADRPGRESASGGAA